MCVCVGPDQTQHLCPCRVGQTHTSLRAPNNPLCKDERVLPWKFINLLKLGCRGAEPMVFLQKTWISRGCFNHNGTKVSALSLSCRFEYMGEVHFPWSFPFLTWLSVKSVCGFAVLMPPGELQVWGAVLHQECSSAAAAPVAPTNTFLEFFPSGPWLLWGFGPVNWIQQGISPVWSEITQRSAEHNTVVLFWGQPGLNTEKFKSGVFLRVLILENYPWIYLRKGTIQPSSLPQETMPWIQ